MDTLLQSVILSLVLLISFYFLKKFLWTVRSGEKAKPTILFSGLSGSGKTALFYYITKGKFPVSFTSATENVGALRLTHPLESAISSLEQQGSGDVVQDPRPNDPFVPTFEKSVLLLDLPGNPKGRIDWQRHFRASSNRQNHLALKGMIFLIDSASISFEIKAVTELLFAMLSEPLLRDTPILICCNKTDLPDAIVTSLVKSTLASELKKLIELKRHFVELPSHETLDKASLQDGSSSSDEEGDVEAACSYIEDEVLPQFSKTASNMVGDAITKNGTTKKIQFAECSVKAHQIKKIKNWLLSVSS